MYFKIKKSFFDNNPHNKSSIYNFQHNSKNQIIKYNCHHHNSWLKNEVKQNNLTTKCIREIATSISMITLSTLLLNGFIISDNAMAFNDRIVGQFEASGFIFKDKVSISSIEDPDIPGVTLYFSDFNRSLSDKISNMDFLNEPSQASISCAITGPVDIEKIREFSGVQGKEIFSETKSRSLFFFGNKTLRVRRIFDEDKNALIYIAYSTRLNTAGEENKISAGRYRTSICVLSLPSATTTTTATATATKNNNNNTVNQKIPLVEYAN